MGAPPLLMTSTSHHPKRAGNCLYLRHSSILVKTGLEDAVFLATYSGPHTIFFDKVLSSKTL